MLARLKKDNWFVGVESVKCGNGKEYAADELEFIPQQDTTERQAFRRETAVKMLQTLVAQNERYDSRVLAARAVRLTDALIDELMDVPKFVVGDRVRRVRFLGEQPSNLTYTVLEYSKTDCKVEDINGKVSFFSINELEKC